MSDYLKYALEELFKRRRIMTPEQRDKYIGKDTLIEEIRADYNLMKLNKLANHFKECEN